MNWNQLLHRASVLLLTAAVGCSLAEGPVTMPNGDMAKKMMPPPPKMGDMAQPVQQGSTDMAMPVTKGMLPFIVDSVFVTSGYMGDGSMAGVITMVPSKPGDSTDCNGMRSSTMAAGVCHTATYAPPATNPMWAGVYWQYPANNWGTKAGFTIPTGATKVSFQAKGAKGGEKVKFLAGGIVSAGMTYTDSVKASIAVTLTNAWAPYTIDISNQAYSQVLGGFGWTMVATDAAVSGSFSVDDIQWK